MTIGILLIISLIAIDQITKLIIVNSVELNAPIEIINNFFYITSHRNQGAAWGMFQDKMIFFYLITIVALLIFVYLFKDIDFKNKKFYSFAIVLLIAGTIGNFIDRILFQEVVDFLDFNIFGYDFPIFNVADMCLSIGVTLFIIDVIFFDQKDNYGSN